MRVGNVNLGNNLGHYAYDKFWSLIRCLKDWDYFLVHLKLTSNTTWWITTFSLVVKLSQKSNMMKLSLWSFNYLNLTCFNFLASLIKFFNVEYKPGMSSSTLVTSFLLLELTTTLQSLLKRTPITIDYWVFD